MINFSKALPFIIMIFAGEIHAQERPQTPHPPFPYSTQDVSYQVATDSTVKLAATLTIPEGKGPFKAILIIGGSGQTTRNQPFFGHQTLWVLSDFLTRLGYATLRFDDRGAGNSILGSKKLHELVEEDFLADAAAGIDFLKQLPYIDSNKIGVIGHSAGASQGLTLLADEKRGLAFAIMLAGCIHTYPHLIVAQKSKMMAKAAQWPDTWQKADSTFISRSIYVVAHENDYDERLKKIKQIADDELSNLKEKDIDELKKKMYIRAKILSSQQFHEAAITQKKDYLLTIKAPVLIINGDLDLNVDAAYHNRTMSLSLKKNFNKKSKIMIVKDINHMLQSGGKTGLMEESNNIDETISPVILKEISGWLGQLGI